MAAGSGFQGKGSAAGANRSASMPAGVGRGTRMHTWTHSSTKRAMSASSASTVAAPQSPDTDARNLGRGSLASKPSSSPGLR